MNDRELLEVYFTGVRSGLATAAFVYLERGGADPDEAKAAASNYAQHTAEAMFEDPIHRERVLASYRRTHPWPTR